MGRLKFLFIVQGEGRGHMTQAIALHNIIQDYGHEVCSVIVGKSERREIPGFFHEKIRCEITPIESPNFVTDKNNRSINIPKTLTYNLARFGFYWKNVQKIAGIIDHHKPDMVINFYEFLCGVYFLWFNPKHIKHICIGHQYIIPHPDFMFPKKINKRDKLFYNLNTRITQSRAYKKLALSFRKLKDIEKKNIYVTPPLLRKEVIEINTADKGYLLAYIVNSGFLDEMIEWHKNNKETVLHIFCDKKELSDNTIINETLTIHKLNDIKFLKMMSECSGYASTAGFESICEAMYLEKPVMLVPPEGHFEQICNAWDAQISGGATINRSFNLSMLIQYISDYKNLNTNAFRDWVNTAEEHFVKHLSLNEK